MSSRLLVLFCLAAFCASGAEPETAATTNVIISSETVTLPEWNQRIVYTDGAEPKNDGGVLVSAADAAAQEIVIEYADMEALRSGKASDEIPMRKETIKDFTAVIFQHEADHLDGVLYIDRL